MRIHPVISIVQLEPMSKGADPYNRVRNDEPPLVVEDDSLKIGSDEHEVEAIIGRRLSRGKVQYLVKWKGYGHEHNSWCNVDDLPEGQDLTTEDEQRSHGRLRTRRGMAS